MNQAELESRMLDAIKRLQPCTVHQIRDALSDAPLDIVDLIKKRISARGQIINIGSDSRGKWQIAPDGYAAEQAKKPKPEAAPSPTNITPGRLIGKMGGNWVTPKNFTRPEGDDHLLHPSRRSDKRIMHTGPISMMTSKIKSPDRRVLSDLKRVAKRAPA